MPVTQQFREVEVTSTLGKDRLLFRRMTAVEELSRPFEFCLEVLSTDDAIKLNDVLGQPMTVRFDLTRTNLRRYFNGYVSQFRYVSSAGKFARYEARLRPGLWFLSRSADCRIFQNKAVPDIVKQVLGDHGMTDVEDNLTGTYPTLEYCVQYRETDFDFVSRLLEQEGIFFFFKHEDGQHTMVLGDDIGAWDKAAGYETVPFHPQVSEIKQDDDHLWDWSATQLVQPTQHTLRDFDFTKPRADLEVRHQLNEPAHARADGEIYDHPGKYVSRDEGDALNRVQMQELRARFEVLEGTGDVGGLRPGCLFSLEKHPRADQNQDYVVAATALELESDRYEGSGSAASGGPTCVCRLTAFRPSFHYRPPRRTAKPVVEGLQTAFVVGPQGREIYTDRYGRVKVQFHWDRQGSDDDKSSCWIRVGQLWASKGFGAQFIPRVGDEVVIAFLEGDPDRPLVVGSVYNGDNAPPYSLPGRMTRSGVKTRSSKGGTPANFNEIYFEDDKGSEEIHVQAERNLTSTVKEDETRMVGRSYKLTAAQSITLTCGASTIRMSPESVTITTPSFSVNAAGTAAIKAGGAATIDAGGTIALKAAGAVSVTATATVTLTSPLVNVLGLLRMNGMQVMVIPA